MAIKKPLIKNRRPAEDEEEPAPKKLFKKRASEPEEEEEVEPEEKEEEEEPTPKKLLKRKTAEPEEELEEEEKPGKGSLKKKAKKRSLADVFDETKPGGGLFPVGDFKAYVNGFEIEGEIAEEDEEQEDLKVCVTYEGHEDEKEVAGKTIKQWYGIFKDGEAAAGIPFLKGDLDVLGYEDVVLADLPEIFADVESNRPEVIIKVKSNKGYTNPYLQGLAEGE